MPTTTTFPDGTTLVSTALSQNDLNKILQSLTIQLLGINPATDPNAYRKVRVAWTGQPGWGIDEDVCCIQTTETEDPYNRIRDRKCSTASATTVNEIYSYVRCWSATWSFYGPNSFDHARLLKAAVMLNWAHESLMASGLAAIYDLPATRRAPELFQGQWWDRSDVTLRFYEQVRDTYTLNSIGSVEAQVFSKDGLEADIQASA